MSRNLKALGLALMAAFALNAIAASAAQAEATFTSGSNWTILSASAKGNQVFETAGGENVTCETLSIDNASMGTDQNSITAVPTYGLTQEEGTKCTVNGLKAMVHTNLCHYTFTAGSKNITSDGEVHITDTSVPPATCSIEVTAFFLGLFRPCLDIHDQTPTVPTVDYTNGTYVAGGKNVWDVTVKSTVEGITYTQTGVCGSKEGNDAKYTGEVTVKGADTEGKAVDVTRANEGTFTSGSDSTTLTASAVGSQAFAATTEQTVACESVALDSSSMGTSQNSVTVQPTYGKTVKSEGFSEAETKETECTITAGGSTFKAMVHTNGCAYKLLAGGKTEGTASLECPAEKEIQVTIDFLGKFRSCFDIPAQTAETPTAAYTNGTYVSGGKNVWDLLVKLDFEGMKYKKTGACGEGEFKNGIFAGEMTMKGENGSGTAVNITWDAET